MMSDRPRRCVLLFARSPREEERRKRLPRSAALFAFSHRRIAAAVAGLAGVDLVVVGQRARGCMAVPARRLPQRGRSFGERLANAFADARSLGYLEIVAVPADVPSLGRRHLAEALAALESRSVVVGPAPDGGVYLLGAAADTPTAPLLSGVRWCTHHVLADLVVRAADLALLAPLMDVDRPPDLVALRRLPGLDPELARLLAVLFATLPSGRTASPGPPRRPPLAFRLPPRAPPPAPVAPVAS